MSRAMKSPITPLTQSPRHVIDVTTVADRVVAAEPVHAGEFVADLASAASCRASTASHRAIANRIVELIGHASRCSATGRRRIASSNSWSHGSST